MYMTHSAIGRLKTTLRKKLRFWLENFVLMYQIITVNTVIINPIFENLSATNCMFQQSKRTIRNLRKVQRTKKVSIILHECLVSNP